MRRNGAYSIIGGMTTERRGGWNRGRRSEKTRTIIELRRCGKSLKEISAALDVAETRVGKVCRQAGLGGSIVEQRLTENQVAEYVSRAGFDYVGGYTNTRASVTVRCRECGRTFKRLFHIFRDVATGTWKFNNECPLCRSDAQQAERERKAEEKKAERKREAQMKAQQKAEQLSRKANDQLAKRLAIHVCKNCGVEFCVELTGYNSIAYCSKRCQQRWHDRIKNEKRMDKLKARPHDTDITLEKLFRRDDGVCYICGRMCDWSDIAEIDGTMVAGDRYPSIDHVKPIAKGGTHTWNNVKLSCRVCNTRKGWR